MDNENNINNLENTIEVIPKEIVNEEIVKAESTTKKKKWSKNKIINIIIILIFVIDAIIMFTLYQVKKAKKAPIEENDILEKGDINEKEQEASKEEIGNKVISFYKINGNSNYFTKDKPLSGEYEEYTYTCKSNTICEFKEGTTVNNELYILVNNDSELVIYNYTLNKEIANYNNLQNIQKTLYECSGKYIHNNKYVILNSNNQDIIYNIEENKETKIDKKYIIDNIDPNNKNNAFVLQDVNTKKYCIYDIEKNKIISECNIDNFNIITPFLDCTYCGVPIYESHIGVTINNKQGIIDSNNGNYIIEPKYNSIVAYGGEYTIDRNTSEYLYYVADRDVYILNNKKIDKVYNSDEEVLMVTAMNYILIQKNDKYYLKSMDNEKDIYEIYDNTPNYKFEKNESGYHKKNTEEEDEKFSSFGYSFDKDGIYIRFKEKNCEKHNSSSCVSVFFDPITKEIRQYNNHE